MFRNAEYESILQNICLDLLAFSGATGGWHPGQVCQKALVSSFGAYVAEMCGCSAGAWQCSHVPNGFRIERSTVSIVGWGLPV